MEEPLLLGAIADDYTGAADLASMLREQGLRTGLLLGLQPESVLRDLRGTFQALIIALKSRSAPVTVARTESLRASEQLRRLGARQMYFKYCSTFDSTRDGNIGPVIDALMTAVDADITVAVPALPVNGRTLYQGYLFVGDALLSESQMRYHPVTPMTESNLVRHLQAQTSRRVGLIALPEVRSGSSAIRSAMQRHRSRGVQIVLVDAVTDDDLHFIAEAVVDLPLITGGSGLGMALPAVWARRGHSGKSEPAASEAGPAARGVLVLSGSCSSATLGQLEKLQEVGGRGLKVNASELITEEPNDMVDRLSAALGSRLSRSGWALVYSSASAEERSETLRAAAARGMEGVELRRRIESVVGELARRSLDAGIADSFIVAGGETAGAVMQAIGVSGLEIGPALDPGVPSARSFGPNPVSLVLKSGNFGAPDFFVRALRHLGVSELDSAVGAADRASAGGS